MATINSSQTGPRYYNQLTCVAPPSEQGVLHLTTLWLAKMSYTPQLYEDLEFSTYYIMFGLTLATLIYGLISWYVLKNFRNYRNFVYLNAVLANFFVSLIVHVKYYIRSPYMSDNQISLLDTNGEIKKYHGLIEVLFDDLSEFVNESLIIRINGCWFFIISIYVLMYLASAKHHWLLVICHMFYLDVVKIFNVHIRWKYVKSSLFGWGASVIIMLIHFVVTSGYVLKFNANAGDVGMYIFISIVTLNCLLFLRIVYSLFRYSNANAQTAMKKWRFLYIASVIFVLSDVLLLSFHVISLMDADNKLHIEDNNIFNYEPTISPLRNKVIHTLQVLTYNLNPFLLNVYLVVVKRNRELWYEFYVNTFNRRPLPARDTDHDINMQERVTRDSGDVQPAAIDV